MEFRTVFTTRNRTVPRSFTKFSQVVEDEITQSDAVGFRITTPFLSTTDERFTFLRGRRQPYHHSKKTTGSTAVIEYNLLFTAFVLRSQSNDNITIRSKKEENLYDMRDQTEGFERLRHWTVEEIDFESDDIPEFGVFWLNGRKLEEEFDFD